MAVDAVVQWQGMQLLGDSSEFLFIWASVGQMTEKDPDDYLIKFAATLDNYHVLIN